MTKVHRQEETTIAGLHRLVFGNEVVAVTRAEMKLLLHSPGTRVVYHHRRTYRGKPWFLSVKNRGDKFARYDRKNFASLFPRRK